MRFSVVGQEYDPDLFFRSNRRDARGTCSRSERSSFLLIVAGIMGLVWPAVCLSAPAKLPTTFRTEPSSIDDARLQYHLYRFIESKNVPLTDIKLWEKAPATGRQLLADDETCATCSCVSLGWVRRALGGEPPCNRSG